MSVHAKSLFQLMLPPTAQDLSDGPDAVFYAAKSPNRTFRIGPNRDWFIAQQPEPRTAAQLSAVPTPQDVAQGPWVTFYLDTNQTATYRVAQDGLSYVAGGGGGGGGATLYGQLGDATSVNLPTVNTPLATALAAVNASIGTKISALSAASDYNANLVTPVAAAAAAAAAAQVTANTALKGATNWAASAAGGTPALTSGTAVLGSSYRNTTAGTTTLSPAIDGITQVSFGDILICFTAGTYSLLPAGGVYLGVYGSTGALPAAASNAGNSAIVGTTLYFSTGAAWVALGAGGGGSTTLAALTDIASYDLGTNNTSLAAVKATANAALPASQKGAAGGVAPLDGSGKVPLANLPASVIGGLNYQGTYNAATNTPALVAGNKGFYWKVATAGTSLGFNWFVGDLVVDNGTTLDKVDGVASEVLSVGGQTPSASGNVVLALANLSDGATQQAAITAAIPSTQKAAANGVATLDGTTHIPPAQIPAPTATTLGGVQSAAPAANQFLTGISTAGVPTVAQPTLAGASDYATAPLDTANAAIAAALAAKEGTLDPVALTGPTTLTRAAHGNRMLTFSGANATLTVQVDSAGGTQKDDYFEVTTLTGSAGVPTLSAPGSVVIVGGPTRVISVMHKGAQADSWVAGTTSAGVFTATSQGDVPASGGGTTNYLRADGTWAPVAGGGTVTSVGAATAGAASGALTIAGGPITGAGAFTITPNLFTTSLPGVVPASGGGTTAFLRADGTWAVPAGGPGTTLDIACGSSFRIQPNGPGSNTFTAVGNNGGGVVGTLAARASVIAGVGFKNRLAVVSAAAANSNAYVSTATATPPFIMPDTATTWIPQPFRCVGVVSDALSACRTGFGLFAGVASATTEPSALLNFLGFAADSTDSQLTFMHNNGSGTATKEVLNAGAGFPCNTNSADVYECFIRLNGGATPSVDYYIINRVTGVKASGNVTTKLPVATTAFNAGMYRNTAANTTAAAIDVALVCGGHDAMMGATS